MKRINLITAAVMLSASLLFAIGNTAQAQSKDTVRQNFRNHENWSHGKLSMHHMGGKGNNLAGGRESIPNLTAEQQKKIDALRTPFQKDVLPLQNLMAEKRAHLRTLQTADKTDSKAVNATIDEIGQLQTQLMKKSAAHHEAVRQLLTDDQRVAFDSRGGKGHRKGPHQRHF